MKLLRYVNISWLTQIVFWFDVMVQTEFFSVALFLVASIWYAGMRVVFHGY
jgi:hypothetical protein